MVSFCLAGITTDWADIYHTIPKLNKGTTHCWETLEFRNVSQTELSKFLVFLFADPFEEGARGKLFAKAVSSETVLGEAEVEDGGDRNRSGSELFFLFNKI